MFFRKKNYWYFDQMIMQKNLKRNASLLFSKKERQNEQKITNFWYVAVEHADLCIKNFIISFLFNYQK